MANKGTGPRRALSMSEQLARLPKREFLTTPDVVQALGVHEVTVYRWVAEGLLHPHRTRSGRKASLYRRAEVELLVRQRFTPRPAGVADVAADKRGGIRVGGDQAAGAALGSVEPGRGRVAGRGEAARRTRQAGEPAGPGAQD